MDKLELLLETFKGRNTTNPLFSLWKHFPLDDRDSQRLAEAHIKFYEHHQFDLMKISPHGRYPVVDYGCKVAEGYDPFTGSTSCEECSINSLEDWGALEKVDVNEGEFGEQIKTVRTLGKKLEELPKMMTIFSPLMVASKMDTNIVKHMREDTDKLKEALFVVYRDLLEFAQSSLDAGAQGLFIASQHFRKSDLTWKEVERFEIFFIKKLIQEVKKKSEFNIIHVHGQDIKFDKAAEQIDAEGLNWHDQLTWPSISEAAKIFPKGLLAGIDETQSLVEGDEEKIKTNIVEAIEMSKKYDNRVIIAPGCVIPITASNESIEIISKTIHKSRKRG
ncbi:MAG: hypothetical protein KGD64_07455 [Candidatus Heimdallarchaeota archaeon]|nr:hypothetical protein [Candidatus Heimdallarchaeota archaeon]